MSGWTGSGGVQRRTGDGKGKHVIKSEDRNHLVDALRQLVVRKSEDRCWSREPALRTIDCVLSLNRNYKAFVAPRLDRFESRFPHVTSVANLQKAIAGYPSAHAFVRDTLCYNHADRAETLRGVVAKLAVIAGTGAAEEQCTRLEQWAADPSKGDLTASNVKGFGVGGFQYLRMLFGANTVKPDIHICRWVSCRIGREVSPIEALRLLEDAAPFAQVNLRDTDTTIWEARSGAPRHATPPQHRRRPARCADDP